MFKSAHHPESLSYPDFVKRQFKSFVFCHYPISFRNTLLF
jgi:hypothetical protein